LFEEEGKIPQGYRDKSRAVGAISKDDYEDYDWDIPDEAASVN
jgi:hypothetical protein